jgi:threonine/homoserine/homoserine lactone efflux protein
MGNLHASLLAGFQLGLTYLVCAVVWITLTAGLYQLVRNRLRRTHIAQRRAQRLVHSRQVS